jgi:hypothetical protein
MGTRERRRPRQWLELLDALSAADEPVTFHDAVVLVRQLRAQVQRSDPPDEVLAALVVLHDAGHTTDGAREVFADYLRACVTRQESQRTLARRPVILRDSGKTARIPLGGRCELHLDERRAAGFRWEIGDRRGGINVCRVEGRQTLGQSRTGMDDAASTAVFEVKPARTGMATVTLVERPPPAGAPRDDLEERRFELTVVVEPRPPRG